MRKFIRTLEAVELCSLAAAIFFHPLLFLLVFGFVNIIVAFLRDNYRKNRRGSSYTTEISKKSWDAYYEKLAAEGKEHE